MLGFGILNRQNACWHAGVAAHVQRGTSGAAKGAGGCEGWAVHNPGRHSHTHPRLRHAQHIRQLRATRRILAGDSCLVKSQK